MRNAGIHAVMSMFQLGNHILKFDLTYELLHTYLSSVLGHFSSRLNAINNLRFPLIRLPETLILVDL